MTVRALSIPWLGACDTQRLAIVGSLLICLLAVPACATRAAEPDAAAPAAPAAPADPAESGESTETIVPAAPKTWHATTIVSGRRGYRIIQYWSKGPNMRAETLIAGHPIVTLVRSDRYVTFDRLTGKGIDVARSPRATALDSGRKRPFGNELDTIMREGGEKVDDTRTSGVDSEFWRATDTKGRRSLWVTARSPRVPIRFEVFLRGSAETITTEYTNWTFDLDTPERFFATPQGIEFERFDYDDFVGKSLEGPASAVPLLYPDLLHGEPDR